MSFASRQGPPQSVLWRIAYSVLIWTVDTIDFIFELLSQTNQNRIKDTPSFCDEWSDEETMRRAMDSPVLEESYIPMLRCHSIRKVSEDAVMKSGFLEEENTSSSEAFAMQLVRSSTGVPVPCVRRVISEPDGVRFVVMDYIQGVQLGMVWASLSLWSKFKIAWTIRGYVRQLRHIHSPRSAVPGPLGQDLVAQHCHGHVFGHRARGPFRDPASLSAFMNGRMAMAVRSYEREGVPFPGRRAPFDAAEPLVFTHHDLNMRNLLLDAEGKLWLIDFGFSGFYPPYYEYYGMCEVAINDCAPQSWKYLIPFMTGPYFEQRDWLTKIRAALMRK